jgi:hypothetical protein
MLTMKKDTPVIENTRQPLPLIPSDEGDRAQLARFCKALAHPVRVQILQYLKTSHGLRNEMHL